MKFLPDHAMTRVIPAQARIAFAQRTAITGKRAAHGRVLSACSALLFALLLVLMPMTAVAQATGADVPVTYRDPREEARFHALAGSLRCVMCQNESLADSQAMIAHDLRKQILAMMRQGKSDAQIRDFLVTRYGEFVLYQPRVEPATWLLWFGPPALFGAGGVALWIIVRRRATRLRTQADHLKAADAGAAPESSEDW